MVYQIVEVKTQVKTCSKCGGRVYADPEAEFEHVFCTYCHKCSIHYHVTGPTRDEVMKEWEAKFEGAPRMERDLDEYDEWEMEYE
jgi:hypothetical protein